MKKLAFPLIIIASLLLACKNKNKNSQQAAMATPAEIAETKSELDKKMEELQQLSPFTITQMKTMLPIELDGDSASFIMVDTYLGTGFARAIYPLSDSSSLEISLFDCAGVAGAGLFNTQFYTRLSEQSQTENGYTKVIDYNGKKAIEHVDKRKRLCTITCPASNRFLLILEGTNTEADELKEKAKELKFK